MSSRENPDQYPHDDSLLFAAEVSAPPMDFDVMRLMWKAEDCTRSLMTPEGVSDEHIDDICRQLNQELRDAGLLRYHATISGTLYDLPRRPGVRTSQLDRIGIALPDGSREASDVDIILGPFEYDTTQRKFYLRALLTGDQDGESGYDFMVFPGDLTTCTTHDIVSIESRRQFCMRYVPGFVEWLDTLPSSLDDCDILGQLRTVDYRLNDVSINEVDELVHHMEVLLAARYKFDTLISTVNIEGELLNTQGHRIGDVSHVPPRQMKLIASRIIYESYPDRNDIRLTGAVSVSDLGEDRRSKPRRYILPIETIQSVRSKRNIGTLTDYLVRNEAASLQTRSHQLELAVASLRAVRANSYEMDNDPYESLTEVRDSVLDQLWQLIDDAMQQPNAARYLYRHVNEIAEQTSDLKLGDTLIIQNVDEIFGVSSRDEPHVPLIPGSTILGRYEGINVVYTPDNEEPWYPVITLSDVATSQHDGTMTTTYDAHQRWHIPLDPDCHVLRVTL